VAIVERAGQFNRVLWPGIHLIYAPVEYLRTVVWSYPGQNRTMRRIQQQMIPFDNSQMDIPPVHCLSKDQMKITVDPTLVYTITDPTKAIYETDDILNLFYQYSVQLLHSVISNTTVDNVQGHEDTIGSVIMRQLNEKLTEKGVICKSFIIQSITMDEQIVKDNQQIYTRERQQKMLMAEEQAESRRRIAQLEQQKVEQTTREQLALQAKRAEYELALESAKIEQSKQISGLKPYLDAGFTPQHIIELKRAESFAHIHANASKILYAPLPYWENQTRIIKNE
jgi:regulator of protease activity HflC (stomatin/prohibitin superfamily)